MISAKDKVRKLLDRIPDESTLEDIQYHIYVLQKIELGLTDVTEGRTIGQEEIESIMAKWI